MKSELATRPISPITRSLLGLALVGFVHLLVGRLPEADGRIAQAFAAGAMLTMLADAMMPEAFQHGGKTVGLFTALGFLLAAVLSIAA